MGEPLGHGRLRWRGAHLSRLLPCRGFSAAQEGARPPPQVRTLVRGVRLLRAGCEPRTGGFRGRALSHPTDPRGRSEAGLLAGVTLGCGLMPLHQATWAIFLLCRPPSPLNPKMSFSDEEVSEDINLRVEEQGKSEGPGDMSQVGIHIHVAQVPPKDVRIGLGSRLSPQQLRGTVCCDSSQKVIDQGSA